MHTQGQQLVHMQSHGGSLCRYKRLGGIADSRGIRPITFVIVRVLGNLRKLVAPAPAARILIENGFGRRRGYGDGPLRTQGAVDFKSTKSPRERLGASANPTRIPRSKPEEEGSSCSI